MIIFDLDQTLIDSLSIKQLRDNRQWKLVYTKIPQLYPYKGINELLKKLKNKVPLGIVTSSPKSYCQKILDHNKWNFDTIVCYHDTINHKPHPEPILTAINNIGGKKENVISIGDEAKDIIASKRAGVISIAALWGTAEMVDLLGAGPTYISKTVEELSSILFDRLDVMNRLQ